MNIEWAVGEAGHRSGKKIVFGLFFALLVALLFGCSTAPSKNYGSLYRSGDYYQAAKSVVSESKLRDTSQSGKLLPYLYTGSAFMAAQSYEEAIRYFDMAEDVMKAQDLAIMGRGAGQLGAILMNDTVMDYRRREYDGIMVNGYKALCFLALGKPDLARVELLRADERQRRAVERFSRLIQKNKEQISSEQSSNADVPMDEILSNQRNASQIDAVLDGLDSWGAYTEFVNPFVTYLHGLFFMTLHEESSDLERAIGSFQRVYGMTGNEAVQEDLRLADDIASGVADAGQLEILVWVVFENGMGPYKIEHRIELMFPFENFTYTGIAVPTLARNPASQGYLEIRDNGQLLAKTEQICSMDTVIASEFREELPMIYARAVLSAAIKTYAQVETSKNIERSRGEAAGFFTALALGILQSATTKADLRIWESLPKNFQIARCQRPESGILEITVPGGGDYVAVELPHGPAIIWIKANVPGALPVVESINLSNSDTLLIDSNPQ